MWVFFFLKGSLIVENTAAIFQVNFAKWEPWHGKFGLSHPWQKYQKIGEALRELAAIIHSLKGSFETPREVIPYAIYIYFLFFIPIFLPSNFTNSLNIVSLEL